MKHNILATLTIIGCLCAAHYAQAQTTEIPLYYNGLPYNCDLHGFTESGDNPGSSTVDPVDPNQVKAELTVNTLVVHEHADGSVAIMVYNATEQEYILVTAFDHRLSVQLSKNGLYIITMKLADGRTVAGSFKYPEDAGRKLFINGQLYILRGGRLYALPGTEVQ